MIYVLYIRVRCLHTDIVLKVEPFFSNFQPDTMVVFVVGVNQQSRVLIILSRLVVFFSLSVYVVCFLRRLSTMKSSKTNIKLMIKWRRRDKGCLQSFVVIFNSIFNFNSSTDASTSAFCLFSFPTHSFCSYSFIDIRWESKYIKWSFAFFIRWIKLRRIKMW